MRMCSIASGSSGNCIYIGTDATHLLVDAGISCKRTVEGLNQLGLTGKDIDGILITHEHSDHIGGLGVLCRKFGIPIYATEGTIKAIKKVSNLGVIDDSLFSRGPGGREVYPKGHHGQPDEDFPRRGAAGSVPVPVWKQAHGSGDGSWHVR